MKVLMVNKFLYPRGGAETYTISLGNILKEHGHEVWFFGLRNEKNTVGNKIDSLVDDIDFSAGTMKNLNAPLRIIYNVKARSDIRKVLDEFSPDVVHLNNIQFHLTPSIILEIESWRRQSRKNCKIIYTVHDYQLICPSHGMFDRNYKPCEKCLDGKYSHCLQTKCLKNSYAKSLLGTLDAYYWKKNPAYSYVDTYICCSRFLKDKLDTQPQFRGKTVALHNFSDITPVRDAVKKDYILLFGRLTREKGVETLLEAAKRMPEQRFVFAGVGPCAEKMKDIPNVEHVGFKVGEELDRIIAEAKISICPSEWYENCPFSVIESISFGTPVIGSRIGGIPELIEEGVTGELFEPGNANDLKCKIEKLVSDDKKLREYTENCKNTTFETSETYYRELMRIYAQ